MKDLQLVFADNNQPVTTSRIIAEQFGKNHQHVMRDIRDMIDQLGNESKIGRIFYESTYVDKRNRQKPMYVMNRDGFTLLAMGFTGKKALEFKLKFIDAFNRMEQTLRTLSLERDDRWIRTRLGTKKSHKPFTAAIKLLINYLRQQGDDRDDGFFYGHITNIVQDACGIIKGQRDFADVPALNRCDQCQTMIANLILNIIASKQAESLADVDAYIIAHLNRFNNLLGGQMLLA